MNVWERVTGSDLTREYTAFEARAARLPADHRAAWAKVKVHLYSYGSFTERNLMRSSTRCWGCWRRPRPMARTCATCWVTTSRGFCAAVAGGEGATGYRNRWRQQLNRNVAHRLGGGG